MWLVIERNCKDVDGIPAIDMVWGYGETRTEAFHDALRWMSEVDDPSKTDITMDDIAESRSIVGGEPIEDRSAGDYIWMMVDGPEKYDIMDEVEMAGGLIKGTLATLLNWS